MSIQLIERHESFTTYDSSKLQEWLSCPRKFMLKYRLGITTEFESLDIVHGDAIHRGMQEIYRAFGKRQKYSDGYEAAMNAYIRRYSQRYPYDDDWVYNSPKSPEGARECFLQYPHEYTEDSFNLIDTEAYGDIPISSTRTLIGKLDLIVETDEGILVVDHKTSKNSLSQIGIDEFERCIQFNTYNLLGLLYTTANGYPKSTFKGVMVNHIAFKQNPKLGLNVEFQRFYVRKTEAQLDKFIGQANKIIDDIERETEILLSLDSSSLKKSLDCFVENPKNCTAYFRRCEFFDFCQSHNNPLPLFLGNDIQPGFKKEFWDPRKKEEKN